MRDSIGSDARRFFSPADPTSVGQAVRFHACFSLTHQGIRACVSYAPNPGEKYTECVFVKVQSV